MHEQIEGAGSGPYYNVYGRDTAVPGRRIPVMPGYPTPGGAANVAMARSAGASPAMEEPGQVHRAWERVAGEPALTNFRRAAQPNYGPMDQMSQEQLAPAGSAGQMDPGMMQRIMDYIRNLKIPAPNLAPMRGLSQYKAE